MVQDDCKGKRNHDSAKGRVMQREIGDAAYKVHKSLGPELLISVCDAVLAQELDKRG